MHFLYVDVTSGLILGLLDSNFNWVEYQDINEKKPSEIIHLAIYELLKRNNIDPKKLEYFFCSGPGSYTGMRLGEGMAQVFEWVSAKVYSFYQFEVPRLMGVQNGYWITNAFKGQVFIYNWTEDGTKVENHIELVSNAEFKINGRTNGFTLSNDNPLFSELRTSKEMIKISPQNFFKNIYDSKMRKVPYYFRSLDEEFSKC